MPNKAIICLGANVPEAAERLDHAVKFLRTIGEEAYSTPLYLTDPEYAGDVAPYLNRIICICTPVTYETVLTMTKEYQTRVRNEADAAPYVAVDIDIVEWNGSVLRPADMASAYFRKGLELLEKSKAL